MSASMLPRLDEGGKFRHSGWAVDRARVFRALIACGAGQGRLTDFAGCGGQAWLANRAGQWRVVAHHCHDRFCVPCALQRSMRMRDAARALIGNRGMSFITLTLRSIEGDSLGETLNRIVAGFKLLKKMPVWRAAVRGGVAFTEVKWNAAARRWHTHLHLLADAEYLPQADLSEAWHACTGDSFIVDIRRVTHQGHALSYVTKYASKPLNSTFVSDPDRLQEAIVALKGRRLAQCFGDWYGSALTRVESENDDDESTEESRYQEMIPLKTAVERARAGDEKWRAALEAVGWFRRVSG